MNNVWEDMRRMRNQMDSVFENFFAAEPFSSSNLLESPTLGSGANYRQPASDMWETEKVVVVELEMPGVDKNDIQVQVDESGVQVKSETKTEIEQKDKKQGMYKLERNYGGFYRYFSLPSNVDYDKAKTDYKNGVLKIIVPKTKAIKSKKKTLEIK